MEKDIDVLLNCCGAVDKSLDGNVFSKKAFFLVEKQDKKRPISS